MMTLEDIRNVEFNRGRGYRAEEVDDFIDECVAAMEQLVSENNEVLQKMKVLADKVAEYRNEEDNIRAALLNAQRTGDAVVSQAEEKAKQILAAAEKEAAEIREIALSKIDEEKAELERIKQEVSAFKAQMLGIYKEHLALINVLPEEKPTEIETVSEAPVDVQPEPVSQEETEETVVVAPVAEELVQPSDDEELKPLSRFADLKFGNDYDIHEDTDDQPTRGLFRKKK